MVYKVKEKAKPFASFKGTGFTPTNRWYAQEEKRTLTPAISVSGHEFKEYLVGKWGDTCWVCETLDVYVCGSKPFHVFLGNERVNLRFPRLMGALRYAASHGKDFAPGCKIDHDPVDKNSDAC